MGVVRRGSVRREELFDALVALLLAEGFAHLTLDDVAARLHCSKRTLYSLAGSKEQLVRAAVVHFFRGATERVESAVDDVAAFPPAAEVYERNTRAAAARVQQLVAGGVASGAFREVHTAFVADVVTATMVRIQQRQVAASTGLDDAQAYAHLAELLLRGLAPCARDGA
jgi:AcrR family transcriptional regulator